MKKMALLLVLLSGLFAVSAQQDNEEYQSLRRDVDEGNGTWMKGLATGDIDLAVSLFADECAMFSESGKIYDGKAAITDRMRSMMESLGEGATVTAETTHLWLHKNTGYETGRFSFKFTRDGKEQHSSGLYTALWKKQADGKWRVVVDYTVE